MLHLILNSLLAMSHCPPIFRSHANQLHQIPQVTSSVRLISPMWLEWNRSIASHSQAARAIFEVLVMMEQVDARVVSAIPFLDLPLAIAARAFALESHLEQEMTPCQEKMPSVGRGRFAEVSLGVCNTILSRLAE